MISGSAIDVTGQAALNWISVVSTCAGLSEAADFFLIQLALSMKRKMPRKRPKYHLRSWRGATSPVRVSPINTQLQLSDARQSVREKPLKRFSVLSVSRHRPEAV